MYLQLRGRGCMEKILNKVVCCLCGVGQIIQRGVFHYVIADQLCMWEPILNVASKKLIFHAYLLATHRKGVWKRY